MIGAMDCLRLRCENSDISARLLPRRLTILNGRATSPALVLGVIFLIQDVGDAAYA
jgi:hypothetical protein